MGGCVSTSSQSNCSSRSNGETVSPACLGMGFCGQKRTKRTFSEHLVTMHNLPSIPNRVFMNGKSRTSCIFTQQGRKGVNQDAMIVWEVSAILVSSLDVAYFILFFVCVRVWRLIYSQTLNCCRISCRKM